MEKNGLLNKQGAQNVGTLDLNDKEALNAADIVQLSHELTYHKYLMNNGRIRNFFRELSIPEYIALHIVDETEHAGEIFSNRTYLKDIADKMQRPVRQISKMAKALQERGLVVWSHDGDGSDGTYVSITESGRKLLEEEEVVLKDYYGKVIASYGRDNLIRLLQLMKQLEDVMSEAYKGLEVPEDDEADE